MANLGTILIGIVGAITFLLVGLPTPLLSGAMLAVAISVLVGRKAELHSWLREFGLLLGGITIGLGVTPDMLAGFLRYPVSLAVLSAVVLSTILTSYWLLRRVGGWDRETAFFSSVPGALSAVMATAAETKADQMRVVTVQSVRLFILFAVAPALMGIEGLKPIRVIADGGTLSLPVYAGLMAASFAGAVALRRVGFAAPFLFGGLFVAAALRLSGLANGASPAWIAQLGFLLVGVFIGTRFNGITPAILKPLLALSLGSVALSFGVTLAAAAIAAQFIPGVGFVQAVVAYAPGALEGMILLGAAMGLEPIFIGVHHLARFIGISLFLGPLTSWVLQRPNTPV